MQMQDWLVIVTGGAPGPGAATARHCLAQGARVLMADQNHVAGEALAAELAGHAACVPVDVTAGHAACGPLDVTAGGCPGHA